MRCDWIAKCSLGRRNVPDQDPNQPEIADERRRRPDEKGRSAV